MNLPSTMMKAARQHQALAKRAGRQIAAGVDGKALACQAVRDAKAVGGGELGLDVAHALMGLPTAQGPAAAALISRAARFKRPGLIQRLLVLIKRGHEAPRTPVAKAIERRIEDIDRLGLKAHGYEIDLATAQPGTQKAAALQLLAEDARAMQRAVPAELGQLSRRL